MPDPTEVHTQGADSASREIRVFISSTFRDFNEERYLLATQIFPELNERAKERGVELVEVDLRWGVTQYEAEVGHALEICLQEIENCKPYFIGLLGESYGTLTPPQQEVIKVSPGLLNKRQWLNGRLGQASYTELEIEHSLELLNQQEIDGRAFFYFRDPTYSTLKASQGEEGWISKNPEDRRRLEELKSKIRGSGHHIDEQGLESPQAIAARIKQDLWALIDKQFPAGSQPDEVEKEARMHKAYGDDRRKLYLGGQAMLAKLEKAINDEQGLILVTGDSGFGKSSLVANWQEFHSKSADSDVILCHHLGCGNEAGEASNVVKRFLRFSGQFLHSNGTRIGEDLGALPTDWWGLVSLVNQRLRDLSVVATEGGFRFVWIIDSLDRLPEDSQASLPWIPSTPPPNVYIVVASLPCAALRVLLERKYRRIRIQELTTEEKENIIDKNLKRYSRSMDRNFMVKITEHYLSHSPLFLRVLLDELRKSATFDGLEAELNAYLASKSVPEFYEKILTRLERDFTAKDVRSFLTAIWASRTGLSETELLEVTGLAPLKLFGIRLSLGDSLINSAGRLIFAHDYVRGAIESRYLKGDLEKRAAHEGLFNWQSTKPQWDKRKLEELPWQAMRAGKHEEIQYLFLDVVTLGKLIESWGTHLVYQLLTRALPNTFHEIDTQLANAVLANLEVNKSQDISDLLRSVDLISDLLEDAGLYKEPYLELRRLSFRYSRLDGLKKASLRKERFRRLRNAYHFAGRLGGYRRAAMIYYASICRMNGKHAPVSIEALTGLVNALYLSANYAEALATVQTWLAQAKKELGTAHPDFLGLVSTYGRISLALGDTPKAMALILYAVEGFHQCFGPNHSRTIDELRRLGKVLGSSEIIRECISRLRLNHANHHPSVILARRDLFSLSGDINASFAMTKLLEIAEVAVGSLHPITLSIRILCISEKAPLDSDIQAQIDHVFGSCSIEAMMLCRRLSKKNDIHMLEHKYNEYLANGQPRIDWFIFEACSQTAQWFCGNADIIKAYSCLAAKLLQCLACLSDEKPATPSDFLHTLGLEIGTSLCRVPSMGTLSSYQDCIYVSRTHRAAYLLVCIFGNLNTTGINIDLPDFHAVTNGIGYSVWNRILPRTAPWAGVYHNRPPDDSYSYYNKTRLDARFTNSYSFSYHQMMSDGVSDLEIVVDTMLQLRRRELAPDDFLIGQATLLRAMTYEHLGRRDAAVALIKQLVVDRQRYMHHITGDPLNGDELLAIISSRDHTIRDDVDMFFIRQLILLVKRYADSISTWFIMDSKLRLARLLMGASMYAQASSILASLVWEYVEQEEAEEEVRFDGKYSCLVLEAKKMLADIDSSKRRDDHHLA